MIAEYIYLTYLEQVDNINVSMISWRHRNDFICSISFSMPVSSPALFIAYPG